MILQRRSGWSMIDTKDGGGAAWGDCGEGPRGQEVTREGFFSKKKKKADQSPAQRRQTLWQGGSSRPHRRHRRSFPLECVWDSRESAHFNHQPRQGDTSSNRELRGLLCWEAASQMFAPRNSCVPRLSLAELIWFKSLQKGTQVKPVIRSPISTKMAFKYVILQLANSSYPVCITP